MAATPANGSYIERIQQVFRELADERPDIGSIAALCRRAGVDQSTFQRMRETSELQTILRLIAALEITPEDFFARVGQMHDSSKASLESFTDEPDRAIGIAAPKQPDQVIVRADSPVPADLSQRLVWLAEACASAADATDREHIQAFLDELVVAFTAAADTSLVEQARREVAAAKRRRLLHAVGTTDHERE